MRPARPLVTAALALALAAGTGGCAGSQRDQVREKVEQFAAAAAARDYATICGEVLAPALLRHFTAAGITCRQAMGIAFGSVTAPALSIGSIRVRGSRASVITLSTARGQQAAIESIELVQTPDGWRISALASPLR